MRRSERGIALLTVLLIGALASVVATTMLSRHHLAIARTQYVIHAQQAQQYALGAEEWARQLLYQDLAEDGGDPRVDGLADRWALPRPPFDVERGSIELRISDLQGRFNLNSLGDPAAVERFARLAAAVGLPPDTGAYVRDWIDADQEIALQGAEDARYLLEEPPYRSADGPMAGVSELRVLADVGQQALQRLRPFVTALPSGVTRININTAAPEVLQVLAPELGSEGALALARPATPRTSVQELVDEAPAFASSVDQMSVASAFFEVFVRCAYLDQTVTMRSVIHRDPTTGATRTLSRDFGPVWLQAASTNAMLDNP